MLPKIYFDNYNKISVVTQQYVEKEKKLCYYCLQED